LFVKPHNLIRALYPSLIWKKEREKTLWLTFDDGPESKSTNWILSVLKEENIQATFFLIGKQMESFPELVENIKNDGHQIGNHSYSHINGWLTKSKNYIKDVERCQNLMPSNKLFRPPFGKLSSGQIKKLKKKYKLILWDVLSLDFSEKNPQKIKNNVLKNVEDGSIIVFHNNDKCLANIQPILKELIFELKNKGFVFSNSW